MVKVRALKSHRYGGDLYSRGEEYEIVRPRDLKVLTAIKAVEMVQEATPLVTPKLIKAKKVEAPKKQVPSEQPEPEEKVEDIPKASQKIDPVSGFNLKNPEETKKKPSRGKSYSRRDLRAEEE